MLYFAYGSNLLTARLAARCPSLEPQGPAAALGWSVRFSKPGQSDGSAKATVVAAPEAEAEGALYRLSPGDWAELDRIEGVGFGYRRTRIPMRFEGTEAEAETYVATSEDASRLPYDWYLALVLAGAGEKGLSAGHQHWLATHPHRPDPERDRPARRSAVAALEASGWGDWETRLLHLAKTSRLDR